MRELRSKVREAKNKASKIATQADAGDTVLRNAKTAGVDNLTTAEFKAARKVIQPRMRQDRKKTAARGAAILKIQTKKAAERRAAAAVGNAAPKKKVSAGVTAAAKKAAAKPAAKATKKPMTASEKAFIKNQKEKAKATKRTGVYPNTAN
jgi:hypothetical protein